MRFGVATKACSKTASGATGLILRYRRKTETPQDPVFEKYEGSLTENPHDPVFEKYEGRLIVDR